MAAEGPRAGLVERRLGFRQYRSAQAGYSATRDPSVLFGEFANKDVPIRTYYHGHSDDGHTSGIAIYGQRAEVPRTGWSAAHSHIRNQVSNTLRGLPGHARNIRAENSHALGHGDHGVDHFLSAPPASQFQNTAQLAFETSMRSAAANLNDGVGLGDRSMVRLKVTDTLHEDGSLNVRRYQVLRRMNADDEWGGDNERLAVDYLMDGRRLGITQKDTDHIQQSVLSAMADGGDIFSNVPEEHRDDSWKTGGVRAPRGDELKGHMEGLRGAYKHNGSFGAIDRNPEAINPLGPAFTSVVFNGGKSLSAEDRPHLDLQAGLNTFHTEGAAELDWRSNNHWGRDEIGLAELHADRASGEYLKAANNAVGGMHKRSRLLAELGGLKEGTEGEQRRFQALEIAKSNYDAYAASYERKTGVPHERNEFFGSGPAMQRQLSGAIIKAGGIKRRREE